MFPYDYWNSVTVGTYAREFGFKSSIWWYWKEVWVLFKIPGSGIFLVLANDRRESRMKVPIVGTLHK